MISSSSPFPLFHFPFPLSLSPFSLLPFLTHPSPPFPPPARHHRDGEFSRWNPLKAHPENSLERDIKVAISSTQRNQSSQNQPLTCIHTRTLRSHSGVHILLLHMIVWWRLMSANAICSRLTGHWWNRVINLDLHDSVATGHFLCKAPAEKMTSSHHWERYP